MTMPILLWLTGATVFYWFATKNSQGLAGTALRLFYAMCALVSLGWPVVVPIMLALAYLESLQ